MKYWLYSLLIGLFVFMFLPGNTALASLGGNLSGRILLSVEESGEAWYVNPLDLRR